MPWRELARIYRRLEARGELRGGHFVDGPSGEQFALPEAVGLLRRIRARGEARGTLVVSSADPINLVGSVLPGPRIQRTSKNRVLFVDGEAVAALVGDDIVRMGTPSAASPTASIPDPVAEALLRAATRPHALRPGVVVELTAVQAGDAPGHAL